MKRSPRFLVLLLWLAGCCAAMADVKLPAIFGDHMVLQQDMRVPVWGTASPGEVVKVTVGDHTARTTAGSDGTWKVKLPTLSGTMGAVTMTVAGANKLTFNDVLIGEVWVCSGQSNMGYPLERAHNSQTALPVANDPQMRLFKVAHATAHVPAPDVKGKWEVCAPDTAASFSAVGYFFGKALREKLNRPVGLIEADWGGTPAQAWTSLDGLRKDAALKHYVDDWNKLDADYAAALTSYPAAKSTYDKAMEEWNEMHAAAYRAAMNQWNEDSAKAAAAGQPRPPHPALPAPTPAIPVDPAGGQLAPATLYNGMVSPLEPYAMRGVIWYQGEQNANNAADAAEYFVLFPRLIKDWREKWGEGEFPFLYVQLAGYGRPDPDNWPNVREAQLEALSLPKTAMATAIDIGLADNIHPMDKVDVGERLALAARHVAYGEDLVYSGPMLDSVKQIAKGLRVEFKDIGGGLAIGRTPWMRQGYLLPMDKLVGFEVAGADGQWKAADAAIVQGAVEVSSADVAAPVEVRYDWKPFPEGNLYNKEGLPAAPFLGKVK